MPGGHLADRPAADDARAHRATDEQLQQVGAELKGRDFSPLLTAPVHAAVISLRPAALFNYNMWAYQDYAWGEKMLPATMAKGVPAAEKIQELLKVEPNFQNRCAIRSVYDGRYRFSRYFGQIDFNRPTTWEELTSKNDVELYDLETDPEESTTWPRTGGATAISS